MNEIASRNRTELNNNVKAHTGDGMNLEKFPKRPTRLEYISSASSSDISEDLDLNSPQDVSCEFSQTLENHSDKGPDVRRFRSMSDGAPITGETQSTFEVFPSLPDSVLEKMGLFGDNPRERLSDEEIEEKFVSLSLAFTIDAATIKDRCERQRRYRDQTETNLNVEIERLVEKVHRLQPLCIDVDTTELLTALLAQVDIIVRACALAAISAERFGAVQHEDRLADSVQLMINHVNVLKQQRDSARRQLQYTKRVLQDTNLPESPIKQKAAFNNRLITRRRASIATISQPQQEIISPRGVQTDISRRIIRRTSELSLRGSVLARAVRPRLELGLDLVKISEGSVANNVPPVVNEESDDEINSCQSNEESADSFGSNVTSRKISYASEIDISELPLKERLIHHVTEFTRNIETKFTNWLESGTSNEVFCFCALMCFSLSIITMGNILVELECAKHGITSPFYFWNFSNLWYTSDYSTESLKT